MLKETIISIIIVILIVVLDFITQNYAKESVQKTSEMLENLKIQIQEHKTENIKTTIDEIFLSWEQRHNKLAFFIEHDELEKVETNLTNIKSAIQTQDYTTATMGIDEAKFLLEHIEDKNAFNLENIF